MKIELPTIQVDMLIDVLDHDILTNMDVYDDTYLKQLRDLRTAICDQIGVSYLRRGLRND